MITNPKVQKIRIKKWMADIGGKASTISALDRIAGPIADEVLERAAIASGEEPLLINYENSDAWCLLTTKRLVWRQDEAQHALPWVGIIGAQPPPGQSAAIIRGTLPKNQITDLEIFDESGRRYLLRLTPGEAYYVIWSAILAFCNYSIMPSPIPI
jgi:hypothetical protein